MNKLRGAMHPPTFDMTYLLPIRLSTSAGCEELSAYLDGISHHVEVIVIDGSPPDLFAQHHGLWSGACLHIPPDDDLRSGNGKVWGVNTGLRRASHDRVVIADDDVRYDAASLARMHALLEEADVIRPQNYFRPTPWHAQWDTARILMNRVVGGDWPGTLGVRRSCLIDGYDGNVLFENLELCRTIEAAGGCQRVPLDLYVRRLPPAAEHFWSQRVRQAYDEFARPHRLLTQLALLPLLFVLLMTRRGSWILGIAAGMVATAEFGRRRAGGRRYFPFVASLLAPAWGLERGVCVWLALLSRAQHGGVVYSGGVLAKAANKPSVLRARYGTARAAETPVAPRSALAGPSALRRGSKWFRSTVEAHGGPVLAVEE